MKLILCAYHYVGYNILRNLNIDEFDELYVYTHDITEKHIPDVKSIANSLGIGYTTDKIKKDNLPFKPDIISSLYYRYIIDKDIIDICNGRIFNAHPSLLPKHRGCSSIPWAIINNDKETGITYHYIDSGIDTGNIILQIKYPISRFDTQETLFMKAADLFIKNWNFAFEMVKSNVSGIPQGPGGSYHKRGCPYDGQIDPKWPLDKIERFIRAMIYPPYPPAKYKDKEIYSINDYLKLRKK